MMDGSGSCDDGLIEDNVDLEDDSINFWTALGVSPQVHIVESDNPIPPGIIHHNQMEQHSFELVEQPIRREIFPVDGELRLEPFVGMEFDSGEAAKTFYIAYAGRVGFSVRIARSRRSKCRESIIMLRFVCSREGFSREKQVIDGKKTRKRAASIREGCKALLEVIRRGDEKWVVTKLVKEHNHEVGLPSKVQYIATEGDGELEPYIGMEFESLDTAKTFYYSYATRVGFEARVRQSRRSLHDKFLKMLKLVCSKHRYRSRMENGEEVNRDPFLDPSKEGCEALFQIIRKDNGRWMVYKLVLEHNHELTPSSPSKVRCIRSQGEVLVIAKNFTDTRNLILSGQDTYPREVRYNDLGPDDAQNLLEYFKKTQEENPAFFHSIQVEKNGVMTNIFWADAKARMAYHHFGDAVIFDTAYKDYKELQPIVTFRGVNHHLQLVIFGCALLVDESEASYVWLFENFLAAMSGQHPLSLVTDLDRSIATAVAKVFPNTRHCFCKKGVLATIQQCFPDFCSSQCTFIEELRSCIDMADTIDSFESCWQSIINKYDLQENTYLLYLYNIRDQWVPVYLRDAFFTDFVPSQKTETLGKVIEKYLTSKSPLQVAVRQLAQTIASWYEKEAQEDFVTMYSKPCLRTASPMEKQAADIYTRVIFDRFQEEFVQSFGYHLGKIEDEELSKYKVTRDGDSHVVAYNSPEMKVQCSCNMFEFSGILCRHALKVFMVEGVRILPKIYIKKRWTKNAKNPIDDNVLEIHGTCEEPSTTRYNDLCRDAVKCVKEGTLSAESYEVAKDALQKAFAEIILARQRREDQAVESYKKPQKKQMKKDGNFTAKKDPSRKKATNMTTEKLYSDSSVRQFSMLHE